MVLIHVLIRDVEREEAFNLRLAGIISYYLFLVKRDDGALREVERELTAKSENGGDIFALLLLNSSEEIIMFSGRPPASVAHNLRRFRSRPSLSLSLSRIFSFRHCKLQVRPRVRPRPGLPRSASNVPFKVTTRSSARRLAAGGTSSSGFQFSHINLTP